MLKKKKCTRTQHSEYKKCRVDQLTRHFIFKSGC